MRGRKHIREKYLRACEKLARWREAKAAKRMSSTEPVREEWRGRLEMTVTFHDRLTGEIHSLDLARGQRRDQYDASVDGKLWKLGISATELSRFFRMKLKPHIAPG